MVKVRLGLKSPLSEDVIRIDSSLWELFEKHARELNVRVQDLLVYVLADEMRKLEKMEANHEEARANSNYL